MTIIPTIFAHNKTEFIQRFNKIVPIAKNIQIDFMDGKFVKAKSVPLGQISSLKKYKKNFEAHLMCKNPEKYISALKKKGFKKIIFHIEATKNPYEVITEAKNQKLICYVALNPETSLEKIIPHLPNVDGVLFLGVHPGKEHQDFISNVYGKIKSLRSINKKIKIQVDGGVNPATAKKLAKLKVNAINSGSFIADAKNPRESLEKLVNVFSV